MLLGIIAKLFRKKPAMGGLFKVGEFPFPDEIAFKVEGSVPQEPPQITVVVCNEGEEGVVQITQFDPNIGRELDHDPITLLHPGTGILLTVHDACKLIVESIPDADYK